METTAERGISVLEPVGEAIKKTRGVLFAPFDIGRWFVIGFCAWLATLGEGGGGFNFNYQLDRNRPDWNHIRHFIESNLYWILPLGLFVLIVGAVLGLVLMWLRCRGKFMFLHCVARNKAEVVYPWKEYGREGNSLFLFKLALWVISLVCFVPLMIGWVVVFLPVIRQERLIAASIMIIILLGLCTLFISAVLGIVYKFTTDFVVPVMFITRKSCTQAWKQFGALLRGNAGRFILYLLFQVVIGACIGAILIAAALATCCCFCCFAVIPYIGTVILLPVLVFRRAYSVCYFAQYGSGYDIFAGTEPAGQTTGNALPEG